MMHALLDDIQCDMAHAKLFKEKTMPSDSDTTFQQQGSHRSPSPWYKGQLSHSPMHEYADWEKRARRMGKRRRRLFSPASPSVLPQRVSIPMPQGEEEYSSPKQEKGSIKHEARAYSTKPHKVMAESKGRDAIAPKDPMTQDAKTMPSKGKRYKGKAKLSQELMNQYL